MIKVLAIAGVALGLLGCGDAADHEAVILPPTDQFVGGNVPATAPPNRPRETKEQMADRLFKKYESRLVDLGPEKRKQLSVMLKMSNRPANHGLSKAEIDWVYEQLAKRVAEYQDD